MNAAKTDVRLAGVVEKEHDRLILLVSQCHEMKIIGDLHVRILELMRQGLERRGGHEVAAFHGDHLILSIASPATRPRPAMSLSIPFAVLGDIQDEITW